jgi:hypothetical protein
MEKMRMKEQNIQNKKEEEKNLPKSNYDFVSNIYALEDQWKMKRF